MHPSLVREPLNVRVLIYSESAHSCQVQEVYHGTKWRKDVMSLDIAKFKKLCKDDTIVEAECKSAFEALAEPVGGSEKRFGRPSKREEPDISCGRSCFAFFPHPPLPLQETL